MKIRDVKPGTTVTIKDGPDKGREVTVSRQNSVGNVWVWGGNGSAQEVRGNLEVE